MAFIGADRILARTARRPAGSSAEPPGISSEASAWQAVDGPGDGPSPDAAQIRAAAQVRNAPKELAASADQVSADMVQAWAPSSARRFVAAPARIARQYRRAHVDVLEQRRFSGFEPRPIQPLEIRRPLRQARACPEQQQESQDDRNVDRDGSKRMTPHGRPFELGPIGGLIISLPAPLVSKAKAAAQDVIVPFRLGGSPVGRR